jgi:LuxR family maltose regulon positive regulatory protein
VVTMRDLGYLQQASEVLSGSNRLAQESGLDATPLAGWMYSLRGELLAERGQLDDSLEYARKGLDLASRGSEVIYLGSSYLCLLRVLFSRSEYQDLRDTIQDVRHFNLNQDFSPWTLNQLAAWQARTWIQEGQLGYAQNWLESLDFDPLGEYLPPHDFEYGVIARLFLAQHEVENSARLLDHYFPRVSAGKRTSKTIEVLILQALSAEAAGRRSQAFEFLETGLKSALPGGYLRTFLDEGPALIELLELYRPEDQQLAGYRQNLLEAAPGQDRSGIQAASQALVEPLTDRELEVLQLIAAGNTNPEIADALFLTQNTVKVHTRNIYGKLGVNNRTRAASVGREMGLIAA